MHGDAAAGPAEPLEVADGHRRRHDEGLAVVEGGQDAAGHTRFADGLPAAEHGVDGGLRGDLDRPPELGPPGVGRTGVGVASEGAGQGGRIGRDPDRGGAGGIDPPPRADPHLDGARPGQPLVHHAGRGRFADVHHEVGPQGGGHLGVPQHQVGGTDHRRGRGVAGHRGAQSGVEQERRTEVGRDRLAGGDGVGAVATRLPARDHHRAAGRAEHGGSAGRAVGTELDLPTTGSTVTVHDPPSGRPGGRIDARPTSGSRKARSRCTGPGEVPPPPRASASARAARALHPGAEAGSGTPGAWNQRTARPKRWAWSIVWGAPTSSSSGGRLAVSASSGTPAWWASTTAGCSSAAAVPLVVSTIAGRPVADPSPRAT